MILIQIKESKVHPEILYMEITDKGCYRLYSIEIQIYKNLVPY
jgi:hypothetical protein